MKSVYSRNFSLIAGLLLLADTLSVQAQNTTFTMAVTAAGNWSTTANWAGGVPADGAGNIALMGAGGITMTLDSAKTIGWVRNTQGSARNMTINASGSVAMTFDNTGGTVNNPAGNLQSFIGSSSSGGITFQPNIIMANTDLYLQLSGSTTPVMTIGTVTSTITATSARSLVALAQSGAAAGITINSSIGSSGSSITVSNMGTGTRPLTLSGAVGPNASLVQNSATSALRLNNAGNTYTGTTTITLGTLQLVVANAIPSISSVDVTGTLNLAGFSDTIDALTGAGTVNNGSAGTPTLTLGGNGGSGTFSGVIQNTAGTLSLAKTGSGQETLAGANTYTGSTIINGGFLNAGVADGGISGPFGNAGSIAFGGGTLQYSAANQNDYSPRFSTAANNAISIDTAGQQVTFATALTSSGGSLTLTNSTGSGTLTLSAAETYSGNTTVNGGTLVLSGSGALASSSTINIGAGGTFDVSALASPYALGGSAGLNARGTGTTVGTTAANIVGASGGTFDLGSRPISLTWSGAASGTDSTHPSLLVSQGMLNLSGNAITVLVPGTALGVGVYTLITAPAITGTPSATPSFVGGNGVAVGNTGVISVSGTSVILTVTSSGGVVGTWNVDLDGNWSDATKWSSNPNVPHAAGDAATFGTGSALRTITLNANETDGSVTFNNNNSFVIANSGNTLTLDNASSGAAVNVSGGTANSIQTAVALNDNTVITVSGGKSLAISGIVSNSPNVTKTLTLTGAGTNILSGVNSYGPGAGSLGTIFSGGGTLQLGNNSALGAGNLNVSGNGKILAGAAGLNVGNNIAIADATAVDNNGNNLTLGGVISGAGGISKISNGKLTLSGANTYSGNTTVNAGVLSLSADGANAGDPGNLGSVPASPTANNVILNGSDLLGSASFVLHANRGIGIGPTSGGTGATALIDAASGQIFTLNGVIASAGNGGVNSLTVNSDAGNNGTVVLGGANTFNGSTTIANGILELNNTLALQNSSLIYNTGTLTFGNGITAATLAGLSATNSAQNLVLNNGTSGVVLTVGGNNVSAIFSGNLSDGGLGGSLVKSGTGTLTLSNANYSGGTTINGGSGAVTITSGTFGSPSSSITVGGNFLLTGGTATASVFNLGITGGQTGVGAIINGAASLTNTTTTIGSSANTAGAFSLNSSGIVNLGDLKINRDAGAVTVGTANAGLIVNGGNVSATSVNVGQSGVGGRGADLNINGGSLTISDASQSGKFAIHSGAGNGFLTMSGGSLTYLGTDGLLMSVGAGPSIANITGGTVKLTGVTLNSGGSATTSTFTIGNASNNPSLYLGGVGLVINSPSPTVFASFGTATVGAMADWISSAPITLTNTVTFQAADVSDVAHNIELDGVLSGTGGLTKTGNGTLTLSGINTYTGGTTISNGTLRVNSPGSIVGGIIVNSGATSGGSGTISGIAIINSGGHTLPGGGVTTTVNGNLIYNAGASADFNAGTAYNSGNDQIVVNGTLTGTNVNVGISFTGGVGASMDTAGYYTLFQVNGANAATFNPTPAWLGTPPANSNLFSVMISGNNVVLNGSPIKITSATATPNPAGHGQRVTFMVNATAGSFTINPNTGIHLDASLLGGSSTLFLVSNGTGAYTNSIVVPITTFGLYTFNYIVSDNNGDAINATISLKIAGAPEVWNGNASPDNTWGNALNWANGSAPLTGDLVTFAGNNQLSPNLEASYSIASLTFDATAGKFNITNGANMLTLTGNITNNSTNTEILSVPVTLNGAPTFNAAAGSIVISNQVSDDGAGFIKTGTNTLRLAMNNNYSGPITINNGVLSLDGDNSGSGSPVTNNAVLRLVNASAVGGGSTLTLNNGSTLQLRSDTITTFSPGSLALQNASDTLTFDAGPQTAGVTGNTLTLGGALAFGNSSDQTINVAGNSTYTLSLGDITLASLSHAPYLNLNVNTLLTGSGAMINSVTAGNFGNDVNMNGGGKVTVAGNLSNTSNGEINLFVNNGTTVTLVGQSVKVGTGDGYKYDVVNGTLVLDNSNALVNNTTGAGLNQSVFILGAATNVISGTGHTHSTGVLTATNNSYNAAVYLGDANNPGGGLTIPANITNNVSDGDVGFTNSGVFTIGGQNTSGINTYANPVILGWTANRGKSVTLVAATGGEVDFANIFANGTDQTAGVTAGDATNHGLVKMTGVNTYRGNTTVNGGTLEIALANLSTNSTVIVTNGAVLQLDFPVTNNVAALILNGVSKTPGVYSATTDPTYLAGSGSLQVVVVTPPAPVAGFSGSPTNIFVTQTVAFTDASTGSITNWSWNFGDGVIVTNSTSVSVNHAYNVDGTYTVSLTVNGPGGANTSTKTGYITVKPKVAIGQPVLSGGNLILSGTNGPAGQTYRILSSTNVALPVASWTPLTTNVFAADGSYVYTNTPVTNKTSFFLLVSP